MPLFFGGQGVNPDLAGVVSNAITLQPGNVYPFPNNWYEAKPGKYTVIQEYDPIQQAWRSIGAGPTDGALKRIKGDGNNYRLANQTGCIVGATITNAGSAYTSAPTVTPSAGSSLWRAVLGGALNTSVTVSNGGTGYTYPPLVLFPPPPAGGVQATGHCTLSAGAVSTVTIDNQGAGYTTAPAPVFQNDPREGLNGVGIGSGAVGVTTLTGSGTITALICIDHGLTLGNSQTTLPTFTFAGGGGSGLAATALMCWSIQAYRVSATTAGSGYATPVIISAYDTAPGSAAYTNPIVQDNLVSERYAFITGALSGTALTATGQTVIDGGVYMAVPTMFAYGFIQGASAVQAVFLSPTMGGQTDTSYVFTT
jgi:hypothetical protein